jgi:aminoglycoside 6'-N-acetyltransferase
MQNMVQRELGMIRFRWVTRADFSLMAQWLAAPPVARWWNQDWSSEAVERDFGPSVDRREANENWLALLDDQPLGLLQRSRVSDCAENLADFTSLTEVPDGAATLDYLLGDPHRLGRGLGSAMIAAMVKKTWHDYPDSPAILVSVSAANIPSWRALEKAGFRRVAEGDLKPDNPIDDWLHYVYRLDRSSE